MGKAADRFRKAVAAMDDGPFKNVTPFKNSNPAVTEICAGRVASIKLGALIPAPPLPVPTTYLDKAKAANLARQAKATDIQDIPFFDSGDQA